MFFIDVALPLPLRQNFTYQIHEEEASFLQIGMRVVVPFGKSKIYTAIVLRIHQENPSYETKEIEFILDENISFYISQAFHMASFCGTGAVIFISSLLTGWMNSSILACRLMPPSGLERGAPYFRSPFIGTPILES